MDYETFGEHQWMDTGIFEFLKALPRIVFKKSEFTFSTPSEVAGNFQPVAAVNVIHPISWADEERDLTAWLGNELQEDAFNKLYALNERINRCNDPKILKDWKYLQASDHLYYMSTKFFSDGEVHAYFNPYDSPYDAYINYMNILSDFTIRLNASVPVSDKDMDIANLNDIILEKNKLIEKYESEIRRLKAGKRKKIPAVRAADIEKSVQKKETAPEKTPKIKSVQLKKPATQKSDTKASVQKKDIIPKEKTAATHVKKKKPAPEKSAAATVKKKKTVSSKTVTAIKSASGKKRAGK
jgi:alpha-amylase